MVLLSEGSVQDILEGIRSLARWGKEMLFGIMLLSPVFANATTISFLQQGVGRPTDSIDQSTLWGRLNKRFTRATDTEKQLFGERSSPEVTTLFGRARIFMNQADFLNNHALPISEGIAKALEEIQMDSLGRWFDPPSSGSLFGQMAHLSQVLFEESGFGSFEGGSEEESCSAMLLTKLLPFCDEPLLTTTWDLLEAPRIRDASEPKGQDPFEQTWLQLFRACSQLYARVCIGEDVDPPSQEEGAPLRSRLNALQGELSRGTFRATNEELNDLYRLITKEMLAPPTQQAWEEFFRLTGLTEDGESLVDTLRSASTVGTPYVSVEPDEAQPAFFEVFQSLVEQCYPKEQKIQRCLKRLGSPADVAGAPTVFGQSFLVAERWGQNLTDTFKSLLWGVAGSGHGFSFHSQLQGIYELLVSEVVPDETLNSWMRRIGRINDPDNRTLFGAIRAFLDVQQETGETFLKALGLSNTHSSPNKEVDQPNPSSLSTSCLGVLTDLGALLSQQLLSGALPGKELDAGLSLLSPATLISLYQGTERQELTEERLKSLIVDDLTDRLVGSRSNSLKSQIVQLVGFLKEDRQFNEVLFRLGNPTAEEGKSLDGFTVVSRLYRLVEGLRLLAQQLSFPTLRQLETLLFSDYNSFQNRFYELRAYVFHEQGDASSLVGRADSQDESLLGLLYQALRYVEVMPFVAMFESTQNLEKSLDPTEKETKNLVSLLGHWGRPLTSSVSEILPLFQYVSQLWDATLFVRSFTDVQAIAQCVFSGMAEMNQSTLESLITEWFESTTVEQKNRICGVRLDEGSNTLYGCAKMVLATILSRTKTFATGELDAAVENCGLEIEEVTLPQSYLLRKGIMESILSGGSTSTRRLDLGGFLKPFFNVNRTLQLPRLDVDLPESTSEPATEKGLIWTTSSLITTLGEVLKLMDQALHACVVNPLLNILRSNDQEALSSDVTVRGQLISLISSLQPYNDLVPNQIHDIGQLEDILTWNNVDEPTLFSVLNETITLMETPESFVPVVLLKFQQNILQAVDTEAGNDDISVNLSMALSSSWPFVISSYLGTPYDTETDPLYRTVFGALYTLKEVLQQEDLRTSLTSFRLAIGTPKSQTTDNNHSCFSSLYYILSQIIDNLESIIFDTENAYSSYFQTLIQKMICIREGFDESTSALASPFASLAQLGTPEPATKLFELCDTYADQWEMYLSSDFMPIGLSLLVGARSVDKLLDEFISVFPHMTAEQCRDFVTAMLEGVPSMLRMGMCEGCQAVRPYLQQIGTSLKTIGANLRVIMGKSISALMEPDVLHSIRISSENAQRALHSFREAFCSKETACGLLLAESTQADTSALSALSQFNDTLKSIGESLKVLGNKDEEAEISSSRKQSEDDVRNICRQVVDLVSVITAQVEMISQSLEMPSLEVVSFSSQIVEDIQYLKEILNGSQEDLRAMMNSPLCPYCLSEGLSFERLFIAVQNLADRLSALKEFFCEREFSGLACKLDAVRKALEQVSVYSLVPESPEILFVRLSCPVLKPLFEKENESWAKVIVPLQEVCAAFQNWPFDHLKAEASLEKLEKAILAVVLPTEALSSRLGLAPNLTFIETVTWAPYTNDSLSSVFSAFMTTAERYCQQWIKFATQVQSFEESLPHLWALYGLGKKVDLIQTLASCFPTGEVPEKSTPSVTDRIQVMWFQYTTALRNLLVGSPIATPDTDSAPTTDLLSSLQGAVQHLRNLCPITFWHQNEQWQKKVANLAQTLVSLPPISTEEGCVLVKNTLVPRLENYEAILSQWASSVEEGECFHTSSLKFFPSLEELCDQLLAEVGRNSNVSVENTKEGESGAVSEARSSVILTNWMKDQLSSFKETDHAGLSADVLGKMSTLFTALRQHATALAGRSLCLTLPTPEWATFWHDEACAWQQRSDLLQSFISHHRQNQQCRPAAIEAITHLRAVVRQIANAISSSAELARERWSLVFERVQTLGQMTKKLLLGLPDGELPCWFQVSSDVAEITQHLQAVAEGIQAEPAVNSEIQPQYQRIEQALDELSKTVREMSQTLRTRAVRFQAEEEHQIVLLYILGIGCELQRLLTFFSAAAIRYRNDPLSTSEDLRVSDVFAHFAESFRLCREALACMARKISSVKKALEFERTIEVITKQLAPEGVSQQVTLQQLEQSYQDLRSRLTYSIRRWTDTQYRPTGGIPQPLPLYLRDADPRK